MTRSPVHHLPREKVPRWPRSMNVTRHSSQPRTTVHQGRRTWSGQQAQRPRPGHFRTYRTQAPREHRTQAGPAQHRRIGDLDHPPPAVGRHRWRHALARASTPRSEPGSLAGPGLRTRGSCRAESTWQRVCSCPCGSGGRRSASRRRRPAGSRRWWTSRRVRHRRPSCSSTG